MASRIGLDTLWRYRTTHVDFSTFRTIVSVVHPRRVKWACTLAGYGLDDSTEEFIPPSKQFVRQRPHDLIAIKSLYEVTAWELCVLLLGGTSFERAAVEVAGRTSWMRAYLDDFRFLDHKKSRRFQFEDDANKGGSYNDLPVSPTDVPRLGVGLVHVLFFSAPRRVSFSVSSLSCSAAKARTNSNEGLFRVSTRRVRQARPVPEGAANKCIVCGKANHGAHQCWSGAGPWRWLLWDPTSKLAWRQDLEASASSSHLGLFVTIVLTCLKKVWVHTNTSVSRNRHITLCLHRTLSTTLPYSPSKYKSSWVRPTLAR